MSRFSSPKSEDARLDGLADEANFSDFNEDDPASVGRFMKKMGKEFGEDLGEDFESAVDEAMAESEGGGDADTGGSSSGDEGEL